MAGVVEQDSTTVVIKKESESNPESPVNVDVQDSPPSQTETNGSLKHSKVWSENETKSMLELHKSFIQRFQDGNYSKKQLLEDVAQELNLIGYDTTPEKVRNKMKYLRARYKAMLEYNVKHVEKKVIPFQEELAELYHMPFFDDEPVINGNGSSDLNYRANKSLRNKKLTKPAVPRFSLKNVLPKKKSSTVSKASKILKKKTKAKRSGAPLFQCGQCLNKFQSSAEMHAHSCIPPPSPVKMNNEIRKRVTQRSSPQSFHWNSLITMQFLDFLKDYQTNHKISNFKKGSIWENIATDMKRLGHKITVAELSKKWNALSTNYQRTVAYNSSHKDKKKCAFFKRLLELHNHQSFSYFNEKQSAKQTVEVSPFSFSQASSSNVSPKQLSTNFNNQKMFKEKAKQSNTSSDLMEWLNNAWTEFKEMERQRREVENQRHNEILEMLSYLIESKDKRH